MSRFVRPRDIDMDADGLRRADIGFPAYVDELCDRIDEIDPSIRAFVAEPERRRRLRADAAALERRWPDSDDRPPLFGLPIAVKDVFHVAGLPTTAGSKVPAEVLTGAEAPVVSALRDQGALVLGKTVTAEFAFFAPGPTRNPHALDHSPGGSSSGSAAAVAAGMAPCALGTQTVGSVIRPAAYCGIAGFKPSYGRVPVAGVIANAPTFDTVGWFAAAAAGLSLLAPHLCTGWTAASVGRPVLGIPTGPYLDQTESDARTMFEDQADRLSRAGYEIRGVPALADIDLVNARNRIINLHELATTHACWFAAYADRYHDITRSAIHEGLEIGRAAYQEALADRDAFAASLVASMDSAGIDAWISPAATGPAPHGLDTTGSALMNVPWTQARLPVLGLPAGTNPAGLPLGVQFAARPGADERLLSWAPDLEAVLAPSG